MSCPSFGLACPALELSFIVTKTAHTIPRQEAIVLQDKPVSFLLISFSISPAKRALKSSTSSPSPCHAKEGRRQLQNRFEVTPDQGPGED